MTVRLGDGANSGPPVNPVDTALTNRESRDHYHWLIIQRSRSDIYHPRQFQLYLASHRRCWMLAVHASVLICHCSTGLTISAKPVGNMTYLCQRKTTGTQELRKKPEGLKMQQTFVCIKFLLFINSVLLHQISKIRLRSRFLPKLLRFFSLLFQDRRSADRAGNATCMF